MFKSSPLITVTISPTAEIDELYKKRTQLRENFRQQQAAYLEATKEERMAERAVKEAEARKREEDRKLNREARRRKQ